MKTNRVIRHGKQPLQKGQIWALKDSTVRIIGVGKTLVFYNRIPEGVARVPSSISSIAELEEVLRNNNAALVQRAP